MANAKADKAPPVNPVELQIRGLIAALMIAATTPLRVKGKDDLTEEQQKEVDGLKAFLKNDPHAAKLCYDGFGIPAVGIIAQVLGKPYLNKAIPQKTKGVVHQPFTAMRDTVAEGRFFLASAPCDGNASYGTVFTKEAVGQIAGGSYAHENIAPATDDEIKSIVARLTPEHLDAILAHREMGKLLRPQLFAAPVTPESPATAQSGK